MKRSYSTEPNTKPYNESAIMAMQRMNFALIKSIADKTTVQFEITVRTDGVRVTIIKKEKDNSVRKRTVECNNDELGLLPMKINTALAEVNMCVGLSYVI